LRELTALDNVAELRIADGFVSGHSKIPDDVSETHVFFAGWQIVEPAIAGGGVIIVEPEPAGGAGVGGTEVETLTDEFQVKQGGDGRGVVGVPALHDGFDRAKQIVTRIWRGRLGAGEWEEGRKESEG
jgi:hypothetical protein